MLYYLFTLFRRQSWADNTREPTEGRTKTSFFCFPVQFDLHQAKPIDRNAAKMLKKTEVVHQKKKCSSDCRGSRYHHCVQLVINSE